MKGLGKILAHRVKLVVDDYVHYPRSLVFLRTVQITLRRAENGFPNRLAVAVVDLLGHRLLDDQVPFCCQENFRQG
ncbi:hypothetical protein D3C81_2196640 [compost metagenome]